MCPMSGNIMDCEPSRKNIDFLAALLLFEKFIYFEVCHCQDWAEIQRDSTQVQHSSLLLFPLCCVHNVESYHLLH